MIPVYRLKNDKSLADLIDLPFFLLSKDFRGEVKQPLLRYALGINEKELHFAVSGLSAPVLIGENSCGDFVEGLWQADLGELFVANGSKYAELNLSPQGAWWYCEFDAPRVRSKKFDTPDLIDSFANMSDTGWTAGISISRAGLLTDLTAGCSKLNVCGGIHKEQEIFLSAATLNNSKADFHSPHMFLELLEIEVY